MEMHQQKLQAASAAQKKADKKSKKAGGSGVQPSLVPFNRETDLEIRKQVDPTKLVASTDELASRFSSGTFQRATY